MTYFKSKFSGLQSKCYVHSLAVAGLLFASVSYASKAEVTLLPSLGAENSSLSRLYVEDGSKLHLSFVTRNDKHSQLNHVALTGESWDNANLISEGNDWFVNWADFPSLVVNAGGMTAHWLQKSATGTYDYDVQASFFDSEAQRWGESVTVNKDGVNAEHGFVSMLPMPQGRTFISWLDGRNTSKSEASARGHGVAGPMTIRAGVFDKDGSTLDEWELDDSTCDCCQTSAAMTDKGPIVVYRDRTEEEIRDIYAVRFVDNQWTRPVAVYNDNWMIAGCPVNGPSIAAKNGTTAVTWFTAKDDHPVVRLAISSNDGETFGPPINVAEGATNGRVGITILDSGDIAVSWLKIDASDAQLQISLFSSEGKLLNSVKVADTSASRRSGFPAIASVANDIYLSWTNLADKPEVKVARIRF